MIKYAAKEIRGQQELSTSATLFKEVLSHIDKKRYREAEPLAQRALAINEKALGPDHPDTATTRANYASLLRETGREAEAEKLEKR